MNMKSLGLAAGVSAIALLAMSLTPPRTPAHADDKPGAGLTMCISLDKVNASREGQLKMWRKNAALLGVTLIEEIAGEDAQRQSSQIDTCIEKKVAGIINIPWDYQAVLQDIDRAHAAGIPFVTIDQAPANLDTVDYHIGADPFADGTHGGQNLIKLIGDKPIKVADIQGALSHANGKGRDNGFKNGIKDHPNIKIVAEIPTEWHPEPVIAGMENAFQANPDIGMVWVASDGMLPPLWSALQKQNKYAKVGQPNHVIVESVDGDPQGCAAVRDGWMDSGYAQPFELMTKNTEEVIIKIHKTGKPLDKKDRIVQIPSTEYTAANFAETKDKVWGCL